MKQKKWLIIIVIILLLIIVIPMFSYLIGQSSIGLKEEDKKFINLAYEEAKRSLHLGDFPVGAVLVHNGDIIAKGHNDIEQTHDHRNHAEMIVINKALNKLNSSDFSEIEGEIKLYVTLEPCSMCAGFIIWKKVPKVIFGKGKGFINYYNDQFGYLSYQFKKRGNVYNNSFFFNELYSPYLEKKERKKK